MTVGRATGPFLYLYHLTLDLHDALSFARDVDIEKIYSIVDSNTEP